MTLRPSCELSSTLDDLLEDVKSQPDNGVRAELDAVGSVPGSRRSGARREQMDFAGLLD